MRREIDERVLAIVARVLPFTTELADLGTPLTEMGIDSLSLLKILLAVENELGIEIEEEHLDKVFFSVESLADYVRKAQAVSERSTALAGREL